MVNAVEAPPARVAAVQVTVVVPVHAPGGVVLVANMPAGNVSVTTTFVAATAPLFVTVSVNVTGWPATYGPAETVLVSERSTRAIVVCDVAVLFAGVGSSGEVEVTFAVLESVPAGVACAVCATSVNVVDEPLVSVAMLHVTVPF